tara:strand:+ start:407 stop:1822 length:1416 start_codon:yes stop_codon:yes gene_type:complete
MTEEFNFEIDNMGDDLGILADDLPAIVKAWTDECSQVSLHNRFPSTVTFFTLLGQLCKDIVAIPMGRSVVDTRVHFCWIQTSGTGKSTMYNFFGPIAKKVFALVNEYEQEEQFDVFAIKEYTDAALIGSPQLQTDEHGNEELAAVPGALHGSGLAAWDEFENSGVFKTTQHKEGMILYLQTMMNSLFSENYVITKQLVNGPLIECDCQRSVYATTYPPEHLTEVMTKKGVFQRMFLFIRNVPEHLQDEMRRDYIASIGTIEEIDVPIDRYSDAVFNIYKLVKQKYESVGNDPLKVLEFSPEVNDSIFSEYENMMDYIRDTREEVRTIASNFTMRLLNYLTIFSALCSIAEAHGIRDESKRFKVTPRNVRQAARITRQSYMSLVTWLDQALRIRRHSLAEQSLLTEWNRAFDGCNQTEEGYVHKARLIEKFMELANLSRSQAYRNWESVSFKFKETNIGKSKYVKLKGDGEE